MTSLWDMDGDGLDVGFVNIREARYPSERRLRAALDALWACYEPYVDPDFREGFARDPEGRFWEMYIGFSLLQAGKRLMPTAERRADGGQPDICVVDEERRIWIEAIAPQRGDTGPDQVRGPRPINEGGGFAPAPKRQAQLRMTSALWTKSQIIRGYMDEGVIREDDIRLIAIGAGRFGAYVREEPLPLILSAVFPIGEEYVSINQGTGEVIDQGFNPSFEIQREKGTIPRIAFLDEAFCHVSGIVWSRAGIGNMLREVRPISFVHNPLADLPMQQRWGVWDREFATTVYENSFETADILMGDTAGG